MKKLIVLFSFVLLFFVTAFSQDGLSKSQLEQLEAVMAPLRLKVETALKKEDAALFKSYQVEVKALSKITDPKKQKVAIDDMTKKYYAFLEKGYENAKIDEADTKAKLAKILKASGYKLTFGKFMALSGSYVLPTMPPSTGNSCVELHCPMTVTNTTMSQNLIDASGSAFPSDCGAFAVSIAILAGSVENLSAAGQRTTIQAGMNKVKVSCPLDYEVSGTAWAVIGGGYADASVGLKVKGPGIDQRFEFDSGWALAPLIWYNEFEKTGESNLMEISFTPAAAGGQYTIQGFAKSYAMSAVISGTGADSQILKIDPITVCQIK